MKTRGRPKKALTNKVVRVNTRLTRDEMEMLDYVRTQSGLSTSEILRKGLKMVYQVQLYSD